MRRKTPVSHQWGFLLLVAIVKFLSVANWPKLTLEKALQNLGEIAAANAGVP